MTELRRLKDRGKVDVVPLSFPVTLNTDLDIKALNECSVSDA